MTWIARLILAAVALTLGPSSVQAQEAYFGKNKVHYKDFHWHVLTTPHFRVYYYTGEDRLARDVARMAERSYRRLSGLLQHQMEDPIPLVLYASHTDFQQTNIIPEFLGEGTGGVTEFLKKRVFLPFTGSYAELEHVLTHELVHAFQYDMMGESLFAMTMPLWFMEGMAEYLSIGRVDEHTRMWLRDALLGDRLLSIPKLNEVQDIRAYRIGQAVWAYIGSRYGDEKIGEVMRKAARLEDVDAAFKVSIGKNLKALSADWTEEVGRTALLPALRLDDPQDMARQLTDSRKHRSAFNLAPAISPSGKEMVFISDRNLYNDLYLASATDGQIIAKLVAGERTASFESLRFFSTSIAWAPDERHIAFPAKTGAQDALYILDVRLKKIVRQMRFGLDGLSSPTWSPDGRRLVFVGLKGGQSDLYMVEANGKNFKRLTNDRYAERDPAWSPDGTKIALVTDRGSGTNFAALTFGPLGIALYDTATGRIEMLSGQSGKNISPQWSKDGRKLAFISDRTGISNIFITDLEAKQTYQITNIATGVTNLTPEGPGISWAQKGDRLLFSALSTGRWDVFSIDDPVRLIKRPFVSSAAFAEQPLSLPPAPSDSGFTAKDYSPGFTLDYVVGNGGYATSIGFGGQLILSFSDILGNHNILMGASAFGSLTDADLLFQYTNLTRRTNYGLALFQYQFDEFLLLLSPALLQTQSQVNRGGAVFAVRPFSRFNRVELFLQAVHRTRAMVDITSDPFLGIRRTKRGNLSSIVFASPGVALVTDNALFGLTGPIAGRRGRLGFTPTFGNIQFTSTLVDYRTYYNLFRVYALAFRLYGLVNHGRDQELVPFGGPYDFRGLDFWSVWGSKMGFLNSEFRFPLIHPIGLRGVLYLDTGGVWDQRTSATQAGQYSGYPNAGTVNPSTGQLEGMTTMEDVAGGPVAVAYGGGGRLRVGFFVLKLDVARLIDLGMRPSWYDKGEEDTPGTRSYRLKRTLNDTRMFFTIGGDF